MSANFTNDRLRQFINRNFPRARARDLRNDDPLLESGIVDSMGVLDLVSFIEAEFGIAVADEELTDEYFGSIGRIAGYIESKQN